MARYKIELLDEGITLECEGSITIEEKVEMIDVTKDGSFPPYIADITKKYKQGKRYYEIDGRAYKLTFEKRANNVPKEK